MIKVSNEFEFNKDTNRHIALQKYGQEWPIVYIIFNDDEAYVGETVNAYTRFAQHFENPERRKLNNVRIITDRTFNKSVSLDLESFLISHMSADSRFKHLQNSNAGQRQHNYFQKETYEAQFQNVWRQLQELNLAHKEIHKIENSNLFKYSPYKSLTPDQYFTCSEIVNALAQDVQTNKTNSFIVKGGPGTGKTILAIYLMKLLTTNVLDGSDSDDERLIENLYTLHHELPQLKIALVISMTNLRSIVKETFKSIQGLNEKMVMSPTDVVNSDEQFDILIVDEAHRLRTTRNAGAEVGNMYRHNLELGLDKKNGNQLDWILKKSKYQIFFYDSMQSIKRTDVDAYRFEQLERQDETRVFQLKTQVRCAKGGQDYIDYIRAIFSPNPPAPRTFAQYNLKLFDNVRAMTELIKKKDAQNDLGLCRNVAGFAWPWKTKGGIHPANLAETNDCIANGLYDIEIEGEKYIWNVNRSGWATSPNAVNEIGCIHTIQGFDLNYAGVIIGNELRYNLQTEQFEADAKNYFDMNGKAKTDDDALLQYILNIYTVLCTRGVYGTYIYACDPGLREYLGRYM